MEYSRVANWPLHYVPPPAENLMNYRVSSSDPEIEEGLSRPDDQNLFLSASISFLQKKLQQKLESKGYTSTATVTKIREHSFSDMLIIETFNKNCRRERLFIKLKNIDKYEAILRKEATVPVRSLSLEQMLPKPKKALRHNTSSLFNIFKTKPTASIIYNPVVKRTSSIFSLLKRDKPKEVHEPIISLKNLSFTSKSSLSVFRYKETTTDINKRGLMPLPTVNKKVSENLDSSSSFSSCSSIATIRLKMAPSFIKPVVLDSTPESSLSVLNKVLFNDNKRHQILSRTNQNWVNPRVRSKSSQRNPIPQQELTKRAQKSMKTYSCSSEDVVKETSKKKHELSNRSVPPLDLRKNVNKRFQSSQSTPLRRSRNIESLPSASADSRRLRKLESKLSLNIEDETDTEDEKNASRSFPTNFTDELKSKVCPKELEELVKRYFQSYDENHGSTSRRYYPR